MNWFQGGISEAVKQSKQRNAIFVVYIEGQDDMTQKLTDFVNNGRIRSKLETDNFIAIKIGSDSEAYMQFAKIYQVVPVPSIFFIGKSGTPIEIGTSVLSSVDELEQKIEKVLEVAGRSSATQSSASLISEERNAQLQTAWKTEKSDVNNVNDPTTSNTASTSAAAAATAAIATPTAVAVDTITATETKPTEEIVCDGDVCYKKSKETTTTEINVSNPTQTEITDITTTKEQATVVSEAQQQQQQKEQQEKEQQQKEQQQKEQQQQRSLEETRKILENRRRERIEMEEKLENERELQRRREGKDAQNLQQWQKEQELKEFKDNIRRERLEEQAARERIRAQIAADRAERAMRFANETAGLQSNNNNNNIKDATAVEGGVAKSSSPHTTTSPDSTRLQFRLPNGESRTHTFSCQDTLSVVRNYVRTEILSNTGIKDFILVTTYPKREFTIENDNETLMQLDLYPSAVILVIGKEKGPSAIIQRSGGIFNMFSTIIWTLLSPIVAIFDYLKNMATGGGNNTIGGNTVTAAQIGAQKRARDDIQQNAPKRRNLDLFMNGPSTSAAAAAGSDTEGGTISKDDDSSSPTNAGGGNTTKPYRRYGSSNIHRLTDKRKDSDDENATWNGNSTQQQ